MNNSWHLITVNRSGYLSGSRFERHGLSQENGTEARIFSN